MVDRTAHDADPTSVPLALGRLRVALDDAYARTARELGLTAQQAELLCAALVATPVGSLATILRCDRSNVSRLVDRAAARGLLRRGGRAEDGRVTLVELSPKGQELAETFIARLEAGTAPLLERWSDERRATAAGILNEIAAALDSVRDSA